jgi:hypothetical protein
MLHPTTIAAAGPLAHALAHLFADEGSPPEITAAALAIVLGQVCGQFCIDPRCVRVVMDEAHALSVAAHG